MSNSKRKGKQGAQKQNLLVIGGIVLALLVACGTLTVRTGMWLAGLWSDDESTIATTEPSLTWEEQSAELTIAASPLMAPMLQELAEQFNGQSNQTPNGERMQVQITAYEPAQMIDAALARPNFQAMSPDSSLWVDRLEQAWRTQLGQTEQAGMVPVGQQRTSGQMRYAVSPVVIVAWESVARELGWPDQPVGWQTIQQKATQDPDFKWNHPSTNNASGLLAMLAEFYAGANLTRGLTEEAATAQSTLDYVQAVEATVRFYGEGEEVIMQRLADEGRSFLDTFVAQERVVIDWNRNPKGERLVAIYPAEGALWTDHPLVLLELGAPHDDLAVTDNQRLTYQAFGEFLSSAATQAQLLQAGYRPATLSIDLGSGDSPFVNTDAVDWRQPQTTLQMPSPAVVEVVQNFWYYTKRPTNVYLVVDTSGSMDEGNKLLRTKEALRAFVGQIKGERDRLGMLEFASGSKNFTPLRTLDDNVRQDLLRQIDQMEAIGGTALIDAVYAAADDILSQNDTEAINALVVMTDGQENESTHTLDELQSLLQRHRNQRLVIFTIAFGNDADENLLRAIADVGDGQFRRASETEIEELYRIISTYF
ncbi:MAG: VWA domain-containing protein [Caldilineaceae bacterium]|nr:VWA domain-containing protein [Caldilineaceae bacterium]